MMYAISCYSGPCYNDTCCTLLNDNMPMLIILQSPIDDKPASVSIIARRRIASLCKRVIGRHWRWNFHHWIHRKLSKWQFSETEMPRLLKIDHWLLHRTASDGNDISVWVIFWRWGMFNRKCVIPLDMQLTVEWLYEFLWDDWIWEYHHVSQGIPYYIYIKKLFRVTIGLYSFNDVFTKPILFFSIILSVVICIIYIVERWLSKCYRFLKYEYPTNHIYSPLDISSQRWRDLHSKYGSMTQIPFIQIQSKLYVPNTNAMKYAEFY